VKRLVQFAERHPFCTILEIDNCCQPLQLEAMPTQNVNLPPHFKKFVEANVRDGRFGNVSEVVRAGLRLLEDTERQQTLQLQALRNDIAAGKASGSPLEAEAVFDRLEAKYAQQAAGKAR
jgi:antitoxin ParD1/3/4